MNSEILKYVILVILAFLISLFQNSRFHHLIHEFSHYGISKLLGAKYEYIQIYNCKKAKTKHILGINVIFDANSHPNGIHAVFHWNKEGHQRQCLCLSHWLEQSLTQAFGVWLLDY